jgi:hypothetical protein
MGMHGNSTETSAKTRGVQWAAVALIAFGSSQTLAQTSGQTQAPLSPSVQVNPVDARGGNTSPSSPPTKEQCISAHRECQEAQNSSNLITAWQKANFCTSTACPGLLVTDCARWVNELNQRIPSVVFEVRLDGQPEPSAKIEIDGAPLEKWARDEAVRLNPGRHTFRIVLEPHPPVVQTMLLGEGMQYRMVSAEIKRAVLPATVQPNNQPTTKPQAAPITPPIAPKRERPVPVLVYPLLGLGAVGLGGFAAFALSGHSEFTDLSNTCAPTCTDDQVSTMRTHYLLANISLGVGAAALLGAGTLYLTRPERIVEPTVGFTTFPHGAMATVGLRGF